MDKHDRRRNHLALVGVDTVGPAGGTFLFSDNFATPRAVAIGDTFEIPIGDLDIDITILAA